MRCDQCQAEIGAESQRCPHCGAEQPTVEVLSPEERENFQGLTIETESPGREQRSEGYSGDEYFDPRRGVYVRRFSFGESQNNWLSRIVIGLIVIGVLFLAFPFLVVILGVFVIGGILSMLLRGR